MNLRLIPRDTGFYPLFQRQVAIVAEAAGILAAELRDYRDPAATESAYATDVRPVLIGQEIYGGLEDAIDRTDRVGRMLDGLALSVGPGRSW